ncbi:hypothetical protein [Modestobacter sp. SYSU DS0657]
MIKQAPRITFTALTLLFVAGCGQSQASSTAEAQISSTSSEATSTTAETATPSVSAATESSPAADEALRTAVQGYSDAFLGGDPATAYDYFSARCQEQVSLSYFTGIVMAATQVYGVALLITSYDAEVSGDLARVSYTYDVTALDQAAEPWARENGAWKQDDC